MKRTTMHNVKKEARPYTMEVVNSDGSKKQVEVMAVNISQAYLKASAFSDVGKVLAHRLDGLRG